MSSLPDWQLPPGVPRGTWEYAQSARIAQQYDGDLAGHPLFDFDAQVLARWFVPSAASQRKMVADLGCGTGRALLPLARQGFACLAVDLSEPMLKQVQAQASHEELPIQCVRANLVELDCIAGESVDYAMSLFSTLGMIQGSENRQRALQHAARILKPGGLFVLHVHNYWYNLYDPGGPWWLFSNWFRGAFLRDLERGDKYFHFRDVGRMYLHVFTGGELRSALQHAGFCIREWLPLTPKRLHALRWPWLLQSLRANGWVVVCQKPA